jgi:nucleotide-binding universal stress UspA family protein
VVAVWSLSKAFYPARVPTGAPLDAEMKQIAQSVVDKAIAEIRHPGLQVEGKIVQGGASSVLIDRSRDADLLVVGTRGLSRVKETVLGSVSHACTHHTHAPIAIIRPDAHP